jgi:hypothetical protein
VDSLDQLDALCGAGESVRARKDDGRDGGGLLRGQTAHPDLVTTTQRHGEGTLVREPGTAGGHAAGVAERGLNLAGASWGNPSASSLNYATSLASNDAYGDLVRVMGGGGRNARPSCYL